MNYDVLDPNDHLSIEEIARADEWANEAINEASRAEGAQDAGIARHHAARAQKVYDLLHELLDRKIPYDRLEERERAVASYVESAFDHVCALREAEKAAQRDGTSREQRLISDAAEATELYDEDELEAYAREQAETKPLSPVGRMVSVLLPEEEEIPALPEEEVEEETGLTRALVEATLRAMDGGITVLYDPDPIIITLREEFIQTSSTMSDTMDKLVNGPIDRFTELLREGPLTLDHMRIFRDAGPGLPDVRAAIIKRWKHLMGICEIEWLDETKVRRTALGFEHRTDDIAPAIGRVRCKLRDAHGDVYDYSRPYLICAEHAEFMAKNLPDWEWVPARPGYVTKQEAEGESK